MPFEHLPAEQLEAAQAVVDGALAQRRPVGVAGQVHGAARGRHHEGQPVEEQGGTVAALERGKIYLNGVEAQIVDAGRRVTDGDVVRVWVDRPGSARRRSPCGGQGNRSTGNDEDPRTPCETS